MNDDEDMNAGYVESESGSDNEGSSGDEFDGFYDADGELNGATLLDTTSGEPTTLRALLHTLRSNRHPLRQGDDAGNSGGLEEEEDDEDMEMVDREAKVVNDARTSASDFYDPAYFDSDNEEEDAGTAEASGNGGEALLPHELTNPTSSSRMDALEQSMKEHFSEKKQQQRRVPVLSNEELLYDPKADDADEQWLRDHRARNQGSAAARQQTQSHTSHTNANPENDIQNPTSDAILSCPYCMTTICVDCQQHDVYQSQFRAIFVMNCTPAMDETLRFGNPAAPVKPSRQKSRNTDAVRSDIFRPVKCDICSTEVGVYDNEEIYHFFNVLISQP